MPDKERNLRDIGWKLSHDHIITAVDLAYIRDDLPSLKKAIAQVWPHRPTMRRLWNENVIPRLAQLCGINTEAEYDAMLARVAALMDAEPDTLEEAELVALAQRIDVYEMIHYPMEADTCQTNPTTDPS